MRMQQLPLGVRWRDNSVFATFVRGPNALAVSELESAATDAARVLWMWSAAATGKSHLLQAACAQAGALGRTAAYFPMRERAEFTSGSLAGCERLSIVCIDDVDLVAGDAAWNRALFNLYNGLVEQQGKLVLTAGRAPAGLHWALPDLASRMSASLVLQLRVLEEDDQVEVLRLRAQRRGLELPEETARYLLRRVPRDLRSLCALLETLDVASLASQRRLTVPFIREVLASRADT
jgi:DnaA family protein